MFYLNRPNFGHWIEIPFYCASLHVCSLYGQKIKLPASKRISKCTLVSGFVFSLLGQIATKVVRHRGNDVTRIRETQSSLNRSNLKIYKSQNRTFEQPLVNDGELF